MIVWEKPGFTFLGSCKVLGVIDCQPANQIQKILDHGHLLTVHDPEQESSELDTVILKALVKGKTLKLRYIIEVHEMGIGAWHLSSI